MDQGGPAACYVPPVSRSRLLVALAPVVAAFVAVPAATGTPLAGTALFGKPGAGPGAVRASTAVPPGRRLEISLLLRSDEAGLARYAGAVSDPSSPYFARYLSAHQVARRFGPSRADLARVIGVLRARGLPARVAPGGFSVDSTLTVAEAERLFSTGISAFRSRSGKSFVAPVRGASLPRALEGAVVGVSGLNDRPALRPATRRLVGSQPRAAVRPLSPEEARRQNEAWRATGSSMRANLGTQEGCEGARSTGILVDDDTFNPAYTPNQYLEAYGVSRLHRRGFRGQGQRVALIEAQGYARSDLETAAECFGHRAPPTSTRLVGISEALAPGLEPTLDLQMLAASAPGLKEIIVFEGEASYAGLARQYAAAAALPPSRRPSVISSSWVGCEIFQYGLGPEVRQLEMALKRAAAEGISVVVASGDTGSTGCSLDSGNQTALATPSTGFPASSPWVTGVGGTNFTLDTGNRITEEVVWNDAPLGFGAGVGGPSIMFRQPSWQKGPGIDPRAGARGVPDVALLSDTTPGYALYCGTLSMCEADADRWTTIGGTSFAAPFLGGVLAVMNQQARRAGQPRLGHINPRIYRLASSRKSREEIFRDVTRVGNDLGTMIGPGQGGNNQPVGCCSATRYFDLASGWGSIRAPAFSSHLRRFGVR